MTLCQGRLSQLTHAKSNGCMAKKTDLNRDLLDEADQEEALGGPVSADANPLRSNPRI